MWLRAFVLPLALGLLAAPLPAEAQRPGKVYRLGYLSNATPAAVAYLLDVFRQRLRELGYVEGQNIAIEYRFAEGRPDRLPALAAELVRVNVDVIVTAGTPAAHAAKNVTSTIPIVMAVVGDPVASALVASLAQPGGNITGLSMLAPEVTGKQLELLKEAVPNMSRVAVLWNPANPYSALTVREAKAAARALGVELQILGVRGPDEFDSAFSAMARERADALLVTAETIFLTHRTRIADLTARSHLPAMYGLRVHADAGGLMAYAANMADLFRRAAGFVDKILKGATPADLPVEQPTKFDLTINLKTAKALGLTIPDTLLFRADRVIK